LARKRGEIPITQFDLNRVGTEAAAFHALGKVRGLFAQATAKDFAIVRIVQKRFFVADAFVFIAEFERSIVFAESVAFLLEAERTNERAEIAGKILHGTDGIDAGLV
jgi:hypothetical protein